MDTFATSPVQFVWQLWKMQCVWCANTLYPSLPFNWQSMKWQSRPLGEPSVCRHGKTVTVWNHRHTQIMLVEISPKMRSHSICTFRCFAFVSSESWSVSWRILHWVYLTLKHELMTQSVWWSAHILYHTFCYYKYQTAADETTAPTQTQLQNKECIWLFNMVNKHVIQSDNY